MKASQIFRSWLQGRRRSEEDWQDGVRRELLDQQTRGVSRKEIVARLAQQMYAEDLRDYGSVSDLGFFTWQLYLGAAQFVVNYMLPDGAESEGPQSTAQPDNEKGTRAA